MTRNEFVQLTQKKLSDRVVKGESNSLPSQVDPTQAQSGRDILFNPKPIKYRGAYSNGVKVEDMRMFDNPHADKFDIMREAQQVSKQVKESHSKMTKDVQKNTSTAN